MLNSPGSTTKRYSDGSVYREFSYATAELSGKNIVLFILGLLASFTGLFAMLLFEPMASPIAGTIVILAIVALTTAGVAVAAYGVYGVIVMLLSINTTNMRVLQDAFACTCNKN